MHEEEEEEVEVEVEEVNDNPPEGRTGAGGERVGGWSGGGVDLEGSHLANATSSSTIDPMEVALFLAHPSSTTFVPNALPTTHTTRSTILVL
jgi:hypothetical protein